MRWHPKKISHPVMEILPRWKRLFRGLRHKQPKTQHRYNNMTKERRERKTKLFHFPSSVRSVKQIQCSRWQKWMNGDIVAYRLIFLVTRNKRWGTGCKFQLCTFGLALRGPLGGPLGGPFKATVSPRLWITAGHKLKAEQRNTTQQLLQRNESWKQNKNGVKMEMCVSVGGICLFSQFLRAQMR